MTPPRYALRPRLDCLQIEVTTHCNLRCPECSRTLLTQAGQWRSSHMPLPLFREIVAGSPPASLLIVQGVGEPTLHPQFPELLAAARATGSFGMLLFYTNGLARPADYYLRLLDQGPVVYVLSLDSLDPDIAEDCRAGSDVDRLRELIAATATRMRPSVSLVLSRKNLRDLPRTLAGLDALGPMSVTIQPLMNFRPLAEDTAPNRHALDAADMAEYAALRRDFAARYPALDIRDESLGGVAPCTRPFSHPFVTAEGFLTPCCLVYDPAVYGNTSLAGRPFAEAWAAGPVQDWLHEFATGAPEVCRDCVLNPACNPANG